MDFEHAKQLLDSGSIDLGDRLRCSFLQVAVDNKFAFIGDYQKQIELTNRYIVPNIQAIFDHASYVRGVVDEMFRTQIKHKTSEPSQDSYKKDRLKNYPIGFCLAIRNFVYDGFSGLSFLDDFVRSGGFFGKAYVILDDSYFHNMIRIGNMFLDVAGDTINLNAEKIKIGYESDFKMRRIFNSSNIGVYDDYASIVETYWGATVYPNFYIPSIAGLYPIVKIGKLGGIEFCSCEDLFFNNILKHLIPACRFLFSGSYSGIVMPEALRQKYFGNTYVASEPEIDHYLKFFWDKKISDDVKNDHMANASVIVKSIETKFGVL